jgi:monothiol glutaredoxin
MTKQEIENLVNENKVVLFMKGTREAPQCGFSMKAVKMLEILGAEYETCNVLADENLRQNIKEYSEWPTIPQLYIDGEFQGGCDIMTDMFHDKSLAEALNAQN